MLINKLRFISFERTATRNPLLYRARKYGFVSSDEKRIKRHNAIAPRLVNAPEIASLIAALQIKGPLEVGQKMDEVNSYVRSRLSTIPKLKVVNVDGDHNSVVKSIVTFYIDMHPKCARAFRNEVMKPAKGAEDLLPITLPKLIETSNRDYLRIALDPARVIEPDYINTLSHALDRILNIADDFGCDCATAVDLA